MPKAAHVFLSLLKIYTKITRLSVLRKSGTVNADGAGAPVMMFGCSVWRLQFASCNIHIVPQHHAQKCGHIVDRDGTLIRFIKWEDGVLGIV